MNSVNVERLKLLLKTHEEIAEEKRIHPEVLQRQGLELREAFKAAVRTTVVPVLSEIKDFLVGRVESAAVFHGPVAAGLKVKLDRWEDHERCLLFFADPGGRVVRITHEGVGFGLLSRKLSPAEITPEIVEEEAMKFLRRLFGDEQLRRPAFPGTAGGARPEIPSLALHSRASLYGGRYAGELVRV